MSAEDIAKLRRYAVVLEGAAASPCGAETLMMLAIELRETAGRLADEAEGREPQAGSGTGVAVSADDPEFEEWLAGLDPESRARRVRLVGQYGKPENIAPSTALALAVTALVPVDPAATADDIWASIYRDDAAADGWLESNRVHHGHPALAKVPLPDGRVVGILDLRPELEKARARNRGQVHPAGP